VSQLLGYLFVGAFLAAFVGICLLIAWRAVGLIRGAVRGLKDGRIGRYSRTTDPVTFWGLAFGWPFVGTVILFGVGYMLWTIVHASQSH
jgi:hypothetical protein